METIFVSKNAQLKRRENTLFLTTGGMSKPYPVEKIRHIVMLSEASMNSKLLCLCGTHGIRISFFDYYGYFKGSFEPIEQNPSGRVKLEQSQCILDNKKKMMVAREIVRGASHNMRANLLYYQYRHIDLNLPIGQMDRHMDKIAKANTCEELMGIEGNIHQVYYSAWQKIDPDLDFGKRTRRPPNNPVNCLISFLNQMTYTVVRHEIFKTHLDQSLSWLHSPSSGRASLSLDLAELFKPVFTDVLIFKMVRKKIVQENWFDQKNGVCLLTETGRRNLAMYFATRLEEILKGKTYREWIYKEAVNIERHVMGVYEYESFKRRV